MAARRRFPPPSGRLSRPSAGRVRNEIIRQGRCLIEIAFCALRQNDICLTPVFVSLLRCNVAARRRCKTEVIAMSEPAQVIPFASGQTAARPVKDLYDIGEIPPLGHVPGRMYAWAVRRERHGPPETAMQVEAVPTPELAPDEVLVMVMAAGVNYNGVWASLGQPISPFDVHKAEFHVAGSDASGIVWAVGSKVKRWKVGDEVVVHCNQDDGDDEECNGGDPMFSPSQRIWGYETPDGSFAQFARVQGRQLMERPRHLTWEESGCYVLTLA